MSLKKNILANYAGQVYVTLAGIIALPLYVRYMGTEAYGLVGFFTMLQAWFQLLDIGLTPTMARQTARYRGGALTALDLCRLLRALEWIFASVAIVGSAALMASANLVATRWLKVESLPLSEVRNAILLIGLIVALRWVSGLYRGAINGFECLVWLNGWNSAIATLRFILVIPFFWVVGSTPTQFFAYQLGVAVLELTVLVAKTYKLLPNSERADHVPWEWTPLRGVLKFSLSIAFTSSVWVLVTQTDKLILSKLLPLTEYAYFTLAVMVASGVMIIGGPISAAILPRLARLQAEGDEPGLIRLYRDATQWVAIIAMPASLILAFFSEPVLWAWTGDAIIAKQAAPVLTLYAIGNGILAVAAFPYYLQFAKGDLKLHLIGNALFVILLIPSLIFATSCYGAIGAGWVWLISNAGVLILWVPFVHRRFARGMHGSWLVRDIVSIALPALSGCAVISYFLENPVGRIFAIVQVVLFSLLALILAALGSSWVRARFFSSKLWPIWV